MTSSPLAVAAPRPSWWALIRRSTRAYLRDECSDLAAGLTYYSVLSLFPALTSVLSLIALVGDPQHTVATLGDTLRRIVGPTVGSDVDPILTQLAHVPAAGWGFGLGVAGALWSASGYVGAFGRALNRIYGITEDRPAWKLRPQMLLLTTLLVSFAAVTVVGLVVSGPVARGIGATAGLTDVTVTVWSVAKWPAMAVLVLTMIALLYHFTPNHRSAAFRWLTPGAAFAVVAWVTSSAGFASYIGNFATYDRVYGSLAGVIVLLLWLWLTNLALLFGAELNAAGQSDGVSL
jgi:membrane protein